MFDVKDDEEEFLVQLMQKGTRSSELSGSDNRSIGYKILRVSVPNWSPVSLGGQYPFWFSVPSG